MVPPAYIENLDTLPFPDRESVSHIKYHSIVGATGNLATMITSRGCPFRCTFCDVPYKRYRQRSLSLVADEVEHCLASGYQEVHFYDDLFNITPEKVIAFCDEIEQRGLRFPWDFRGRVNTATQESLARARKAGCRMISFGVETGTDEGLALLRKDTNIQQVRNVFRWCRELGIRTIADFMIGLPFERSPGDIDRNIDFLLDIDPDYAQIGVLTLYPNTAVYDAAVAKGLIDPGRWQAFALDPQPGFHVDHWEEFMPTTTLVGKMKSSYKRFYLRPKYILRSALNVRTPHEFLAKTKGFVKLIT
jgi:radical SAM superfamily enzyme YgiQ (UPF0313 family)